MQEYTIKHNVKNVGYIDTSFYYILDLINTLSYHVNGQQGLWPYGQSTLQGPEL